MKESKHFLRKRKRTLPFDFIILHNFDKNWKESLDGQKKKKKVPVYKK